jgi:hypothetical protein
MKNECKKCGSRGDFESPEGKLVECECQLIRRIAASMPPFIRRAQVFPNHISHPIISMAGKNLFIRSSWADMKAIMKVIWFRYNGKFMRVTSDLEIKNVFLGGSSRNAKGEDFTGDIFNNVHDLMKDPDLVIVELNKIGYKNKSAPGNLREAMDIRVSKDKPIWLFSDTSNPFVETSVSYSNHVWEYIVEYFKMVTIPRISPEPSPPSLQDDSSRKSSSVSFDSIVMESKPVDNENTEEPAEEEITKSRSVYDKAYDKKSSGSFNSGSRFRKRNVNSLCHQILFLGVLCRSETLPLSRRLLRIG